MIKFLAQKDGRPMIGLGLSKENCKKLLEGKPIFIDLKVMLMNLPGQPILNETTIFIFGGETEQTMQDELSSLLGKLPNPQIDNQEN